VDAPNRSGYGIAAAGGVVWRDAGQGRVEVAIIHRNRYDDWTLPKGKLEPGETELLAAVREVGEEIGSRVAVQRRLGRGGYRVGRESKSVAFWSMHHRGGHFEASQEVDRMRWVDPGPARDLLSYPLDREMLDRFADTPVPDSVLVLVRHARAGKRANWPGEDSRRPLDNDGRRQARRLARLLPCFAPEQIASADRVRCVQTVEPTAEFLGLPIEIRPAFSDESYQADPVRALDELRELIKAEASTVLCSQGEAIPALLDVVAPRGVAESFVTRKAATWVVSFADGVSVAADYYEDAVR
jgi:phosphohistidine phosphatase SixA/ADP-ribose pyrophosphatase YjhB (NUDIX family)